MKAIFSLFILSMITFSINAQTPVAEYHFSDGSLDDSSLSGFNLTVNGNVIPSDDQLGDANQAMYFNDGNLTGDEADILNMNEPITIACWVKLDTFINEWTAIINKWEAAAGSYYLGINPENNSMRWNAFVANVEDPEPVEIGVWMHFAAIYDGLIMKLYRDGILVSSQNVGEIYGANNLPMRLGAQSNVTLNNFVGSIDEVYVYKAALSDTQITDLYNGILGAPEKDLGIIDLTMNEVQVKGSTIEVEGKIYNYGSEAVNDFEINISDGTQNITVDFSNLNLNQLEPYFFSETVNIPLEVGDVKSMTVSIGNVNGSMDDNESNNVRTESITGFSFLPNRKMVIEEATGTWCQWCPRGDIALKQLYNNYPDNFIGIAVHSGDTMQVEKYVTNAGFVSYPSCHVDRKLLNTSIDPIAAESYYIERVLNAKNTPLASLSHSTEYNHLANELVVNQEVIAAFPLRGQYKMSVVITEDMVTGNTSDFDQVNAYAGGANGEMGGYENLPNPVPASDMVYSHVAREILGEYGGYELFPNDISPDAILASTITGSLPENVILENLNIVSLFLSPSGEIVNAFSSKLIDGFVDVEEQEVIQKIKIFPNPSSELSFVEINLERAQEVSLQIFDMRGALQTERNYGEMIGKNFLPIKANENWKGMYVLKLQIDGNIITDSVIFH